MRKRPVRKPWSDDVGRKLVVIEARTTCVCCRGSRLAKIGAVRTTYGIAIRVLHGRRMDPAEAWLRSRLPHQRSAAPGWFSKSLNVSVM